LFSYTVLQLLYYTTRYEDAVYMCLHVCDSNRPEKRFAFKDARLPPKPASRSVEFKAGDSVEASFDVTSIIVIHWMVCNMLTFRQEVIRSVARSFGLPDFLLVYTAELNVLLANNNN